MGTTQEYLFSCISLSSGKVSWDPQDADIGICRNLHISIQPSCSVVENYLGVGQLLSY